jgi:hypothetical protein
MFPNLKIKQLTHNHKHQTPNTKHQTTNHKHQTPNNKHHFFSLIYERSVDDYMRVIDLRFDFNALK